MVDTIINIIKTIQELITNLVKWILSVFDVFGILFTYISILLVTVLIVTYQCLKKQLIKMVIQLMI